MQFDLLKITPVMNYIQNVISPGMGKRLSNEYIIHCPFCDDATRANANSHGHLYLSLTSPVFHCFRCDASGTLVSLLLNTGFTDREVLNYLSSFIKINFTKDYYKIKDRKNIKDKSKILLNYIYKNNKEFKKNFNNLYNTYRNYISTRIGSVNFINFLLTPGIYNNLLFCKFNNFDGENILIRYIDLAAKKRYQINKKTSNLYYFQELDFEKYNKITLTEGPFDIINLSLYNNTFKDNLFISINGKNYSSVIERFIIMYLLIGSYEINIVLDDDYVNKFKSKIKNIKNIIDVYNREISLKVYKPLFKNTDVSDFPATVEVTYESE